MNGSNEKVVILPDEESCKTLIAFLQTVKGLSKKAGNRIPLEIIPSDDILAGLKGYIIFETVFRTPSEIDRDEAVLYVAWRFAEPIRATFDVDQDQIEVALRECVSSEKWVLYDDPKRLRVGFFNREVSMCRFFPIRGIQMCSDELKEIINQYRKSHNCGGPIVTQPSSSQDYILEDDGSKTPIPNSTP